MPSATFGAVLIVLAVVNIIISLAGSIYSKVAMASWTPSMYDGMVKQCKEESSNPYPGDVSPLACLDADLDCGSTKCFPGEYCIQKESEQNGIKLEVGTCERCTVSKMSQPGTFPGTNTPFDFTGKPYSMGLTTAKRCQPFVQSANNKPHDNNDDAYQMHGGVYTCFQKAECATAGCTGRVSGSISEAARLNTMVCPRVNPFKKDGLGIVFSTPGPKEEPNMEMCYIPGLVSDGVTIVASLVVALGGVIVIAKSGCADIFVWVAVAACAVALVTSIACSVATGVCSLTIGNNNFLKTAMSMAKELIPEQPTEPGDKAQGTLRGPCPKSCRQVKGAVGVYVTTFLEFTNVVLGLLVAQVLLIALTIGALLMGPCCSDQDNATNTKKAIGLQKKYITNVNKKKKKPEPAVTAMPVTPKADRRKSMATRAVPFAPGSSAKSLAGPGKAAGEILVAIYDFSAQSSEELSFDEGDKIELIEEFSDGWAQGKLCDGSGSIGLFPLNYTLGKDGRV